MAEDFQPSYWWNNSAGGGSQPITSALSSSLSRSTAIPDAGGGGASFSWSSTTEISESKPTIIFDNQIDSSHTPDFNWSQTLPGKAECSFHSMLHDHDRSARPFSRPELGESSSTIPFKDGNSSSSSSPSSSSSNMYSSSSMLRGLVEPDSRFQRRPCSDNQKTTNHDCYQSQIMAFHGVSINETQLQPSWKLFADANCNPLWNNNASAAGFYPSPLLSPSRTQISESNSGCRKTGMGLGGDWEERASQAPEQKKTRIEAASATPAITVIRKENLRERITALQQLVSPFGKTDTASVLQEAIEYIKFLHEQVSVLCAPYFKTGRPPPQIQSSGNKCAKAKVEEGRRADEVLRSRGLCLVPMESIYSADSESIATNTSEFWTPIHGRTYW